MGQMKKLFMDIIQQKYNGDYDAFIEELSKQTCEEFVPVDTVCPNCFKSSISRNETNAKCDACGQDFVYVENSLKFL
jgi:Zn finger protein HypA/HybF involved in hydrogenase expression